MISWTRDQLLVAILFVSVAWIWGGSFVAIEVGLHSFPPLWFAALRYLVAGVVVSGIAVATGRFRPRGRREWGAIAVVGGLVVALYHGLLFVGEQSVSGAIAAVVVSLSPVLTGVFAGAILPDEGLDSTDIVGLVLGIAGVVVIANPTGGGVALGGVALVFLGVVAFALGSVGLQAFDTDLPAATLQGWAMLFGAALLVVAAVLRGEAFPEGTLSTTALASFGYLSLVSGVLGYLAYLTLLSKVGSVQVNLVAYLEPVTAAIVAWGVLGAAPTAATGAGFLLVFAGFALTTLDDPFGRVDVLLEREVELPAGTKAAVPDFSSGADGSDWRPGD